ncbi:protein of unknown function [Thauera humireducens]|nr:protein of unknown function [Thauera humireducens]
MQRSNQRGFDRWRSASGRPNLPDCHYGIINCQASEILAKKHAKPELPNDDRPAGDGEHPRHIKSDRIDLHS